MVGSIDFVQNSSMNEPSFFVKGGDEFIKILVKDIDYIEGLKD